MRKLLTHSLAAAMLLAASNSHAGLLGYWPFDNNYSDLSPASRSAAAGPGTQAPVFSTDVPVQLLGRASSRSLDMRSSNRYAFVPGSANFYNSYNATTNPSGSFTVSCWVKGWPTGTWVPIVSKNGESNGGWQVRRSGDSNEVDWTTRGAGFANGGDFNTGAVVANGGLTSPGVRNTQWYHYVCTFDGTNKNIYLNGQLVSQQANAGARIQDSAKLLVFGARDEDGGSIGSYSLVQLDEVAIWDNALTQTQILDLFSGTDPRFLHSVATPWNLGEPWGIPGFWGIKEVKTSNTAWQINNLNTAAGALMNNTGFTTQSRSVIDFKDPNNAGGGSGTALSYLTDTTADDEDFAMVATCCFRVTTAGQYTFEFKGDDGFEAAIFGTNWGAINASNGNASMSGEYLRNMVPTGDTNTYAVVTLAAGDYNFRYLWYERAGGAFNRIRIASGNKSGDDGSFTLLGSGSVVALVNQAPMLHSFTSNSYSVITTPALTPATLTFSWDTKYASALSITPTLPGNPAITPGTNSVTFASPTTTTTYTLTGTTGAQVRTSQFTVNVDLPPTITSFAFTDNTRTAGSSATFNWNVVGATSLSINQGIGAVTPTGIGSLNITAPANTTTYTISATNAHGTVTAQATLNIGLPPVIDSFTTPDNAIIPGSFAQLDWQTSFADTVTLSPRPGAVALDSSYVETPALGATYTLTATNTYASVSQNVAISMAGALTITSAGWSQTRITSPVAVTSLSICDQLIAGQIAGSTTFTQNGLTQINQGDGAVGVFAGGETLPPGGNGDNFVVVSTATLRIFYPGYYTFGINNDDGGRLRIDGNNVIVNDTVQSPTSVVSSPTYLASGDHTIEYLYFEQGGGFAGEIYYVRGDGAPFLLTTNMPSPQAIPGSDLRITEFCADNTQLEDAQGDSPDWIEIFNPTASAINLAGYYLTNSALAADDHKWAFPSHSLPAGGYLVVFASAKNTTLPVNQFHTNFTLAKDGGYLALTKGSGTPGVYSLVDSYTYGAQSEDNSYGRYDSENYTGFFDFPSPGSVNPGGVDGFVGDTHFSVDRGIKSAAFSLAITCDEPTATIRYTTNGAPPTETTGTVYTGPINISATTVIRAAGFKTRWKPTNVDTHSYFFLNDVILQSAASTLADGWPNSPVAGQVLDYGMDSRVVSGNQALLTSALAAIPSVSIVTNLDNLLHPTTGIYVDANQHGENWERPASIEYINDTYNGQVGGGGAFQIDCGLRIRGGYSRSDDNPKHAFRLFFQKQYDGNLQYPLFGKEGTDQFENLDLQTSQNYSWSFDPGTSPGSGYQGYTFLREVLSRDNMRDMGQPHTRSRYVHLYINGKYWGLYMTQERAEANFGQNYLGGNEDNYDVIKSAGGSGGYNTEATDGTMAQGTSAVPGSTWARLWWRSIDLRNDTGSEASRTARYFAMQGLQSDGVTPDAANPKVLNPDNLADYMLNTFQTGSFDAPLSTFVAASNNWFGLKERTLNTGFVFIAHDHEHGMGTDSDGRSDNRVGPWAGDGTNAFGQAMHNNINNYDKANPAYIHEAAAFSLEYRVKFGDRVHKHLFNNGTLTNANVIARMNTRAAIMDGIVLAESARWGDSKTGGATYFVKNDWLNAKTRLTNWVNTGTIATLNAGTGPGRASTIITQLRAYKDKPSGTSAGAGDATLVTMPLYPITDAPVFSQFGGIVAQNFQLTITDPNGSNPQTSGNARTIYYRLDEQDPRAIGGGIRAGNLTGSPATLTTSGFVKARIFNSTRNEWSALTEALYVVGVPAASTNLVISEINYNPKGPFVAPATDNDDYEFIELWNPTASTVQLDGVAFTSGISFDFTTQSSISTLGPGGRLVLVKNLAAFQSRYPDASYPGLSAKIAGVYLNSLDNGGEQLILRNTIAAADIANFTYEDTLPWPDGPDGNGATLVFTTTTPTTAAKNDGKNWFPHGLLHGNPAGLDITGYAVWATTNSASADGLGDNDRDNILDLTEYTLGTNPNAPSGNLPAAARQILTVGGIPAEYFTLSFTRAAGNGDVSVVCETDDNLAAAPGWTANGVLVSRVYNPEGTETFTFRHPNPATVATHQFMRIKTTLP